MKASEFPATLTTDGKFDIPAALVKKIPSGQTLRVIVLVAEPEESAEVTRWQRLTTEQFLQGYDESDSIHDELNIQ